MSDTKRRVCYWRRSPSKTQKRTRSTSYHQSSGNISSPVISVRQPHQHRRGAAMRSISYVVTSTAQKEELRPSNKSSDSNQGPGAGKPHGSGKDDAGSPTSSRSRDLPARSAPPNSVLLKERRPTRRTTFCRQTERPEHDRTVVSCTSLREHSKVLPKAYQLRTAGLCLLGYPASEGTPFSFKPRLMSSLPHWAAPASLSR
jgi:hypothetical protein